MSSKALQKPTQEGRKATALSSGWVTYRFRANPYDPNPVKSPPPGPFWVRGIATHCYARMIAILPVGVALTDWWPEAEEDAEPVSHATLVLPEGLEAPVWWTTLQQRSRLEQVLPVVGIAALPAARF